MAKVAKPKKARTGPSVHSRAVKRAASPSIDLDKSITSASLPTDPTDKDTDLSNRDKITRKVFDIAHRTTTPNGISKKQKAVRGARTKHQKARKEMGREKAEAIAEILDRKVADREKKVVEIKERAKDWDTVNSKTAFEALASVEI